MTEPDFEYVFIYSQISFVKAASTGGPGTESAIDPTHRISRLASANRIPVSVKPDSTLQQCVTLMLTHDYSQLPVMTSTRDLKGIVSWKSIGSRLALQRMCNVVRDVMEEAREVSSSDSLFSAISAVAECDYVLVRAKDEQIYGIITASDLTEQFQKPAEPFLLVGEIENGVRRMLHSKFTKTELAAVKLPDDTDRVIEAVSDLTFGEYIRLIETPANWAKLKLEVDRRIHAPIGRD